MLKKIERYVERKMRRAVNGRVEYLTISAYKAPTDGKHEITVLASYDDGTVANGGVQTFRIPKVARTDEQLRRQAIHDATTRVVKYFAAFGYTLIALYEEGKTG